MKSRTMCVVGLFGIIALTGASAQQAPRARATVVTTTPATVTVSFRGPEARPYLTVKASGSDVRATLREIGTKANARILVAPSASGTITGNVDSEPTEAAITAVAKMAGLNVRTVILPEATAATITPDVAGRYAETLTTLPAGAAVTDPATGKALTVTTTLPKPTAGQAVVYYVQGTMTPDQERMAQFRRAQPQPGAPEQPSTANADFVNQTAQNLSKMPLQQRMDTMRALQRQMFESMTPEERDQMRQQFRGPGGQGGPGGFGRGNRGNRNQDGGPGAGGGQNGQ